MDILVPFQKPKWHTVKTFQNRCEAYNPQIPRHWPVSNALFQHKMTELRIGPIKSLYNWWNREINVRLSDSLRIHNLKKQILKINFLGHYIPYLLVLQILFIFLSTTFCIIFVWTFHCKSFEIKNFCNT